MTLFLFEFMDLPWIPASLHATLLEVLEFQHKVNLSYYYRWATEETLKRAEAAKIPRVIEMGAGAAGFSEALATRIRDQKKNLQVEICDLRPNVQRYQDLEREFPGIVLSRKDPVDLTLWVSPPTPVLLVISATFHHIPPDLRPRVLASIAKTPTMVFESLSRNWLSILGCALEWVPGLVVPLYFLRRPAGRWRRFFWCWIIPVAPFMVAFDGIISSLRTWTASQWRYHLGQLGVPESAISIQTRGLSHLISW